MTEEQPTQPPEQPEEEEQHPPYETQRIPFSREDLINVHSLRNTEFKEDLIKQIYAAHIYASAKRELIKLVLNFHSQNWMLANFEKGGSTSSTNSNELLKAQLMMQRDFLFGTLAYCPSDLCSPDMVNILKAIESHFVPTLSRAKGIDRERRLNAKFITGIEQTIERREPMMQQQPAQKERRPFLSFLRR